MVSRDRYSNIKNIQIRFFICIYIRLDIRIRIFEKIIKLFELYSNIII